MQGKLYAFLGKMLEDKASDLFITAGSPVCERRGQDVEAMIADKLTADQARALVQAVYATAGRDLDRLSGQGDDDFSFAVPDLARFRANVYRQRGSLSAVLRAVPFDIPDYRTLGIPEAVMDLARLQSGLVVVTGAAGSGKSTTQACIIDRINHTKKRHVVTLEDPIEYLHKNDMSVVSQREIYLDTGSYGDALRSCLRQSPDVIYLGEMRDGETIRTAMTAAETGHLVLGTLHTHGASNTVDRIIDAFPPEQQHQVRVQLAMVLDTVVFQQLVQTSNGPVAAFEIMKATPGIRGLIRDAKTHQLDASIQSGQRDGMLSMDASLNELVRSGRASRDEVLHLMSNPDRLRV